MVDNMLVWAYCQSMKTVLEHLKDHHLDVELHRPMIDEEDRVATFYLYDLVGRAIGYQDDTGFHYGRKDHGDPL